MKDEDKTKEQLIRELEELRQRLAETALSETERRQAEEALRQSEGKYRVLIESLFDTVYQFDLEGKFVYANKVATRMFGYSMDEILNSIRVNDTMDEKDLIVSRRDIAEVLKGQSVTGERTFVRKDGTKFVGEVHSGPVYEGEKIVGVRGVLRDITERKQIEHDLNERVKELQCLYSIGNIVERPGISLNELYQEVTNLLPVSWQYPEISCARIIINDKEFRTANYAETQWKLASSIKVHEIKTGIVEVSYLESRPEIDEGSFSKEEKRLIDAVAERLGRITERMLAEEALAKAKDDLEIRVKERTVELERLNKDLYGEIADRERAEKKMRILSRRLLQAQEDERRFIAQELHDQIGQQLAYLSLLLDKAKRVPSEIIPSVLDEAKTLVTETANQVRNLSTGLSPNMLLTLGLLETLIWHFENYTSQTGIRIDFKHARLPKNLSTEVNITAYRIIQEALTNIARHSGVSEATVNIRANRGVLRIEIVDKGIGFVPEAVEFSSGLSGMRERVNLLGGILKIISSPASGTSITAELPLSDRIREVL